ncbi:putative halogenase [Armillaria novae-zelandiae]|uniref:Halogenase n=1 Tax=Armillaria novae-zelandiae TaxID=153914 RepID=A0AA39U4X3_9AGAR|nr:putative halogenase [Armillaria novae-zelandiae]
MHPILRKTQTTHLTHHAHAEFTWPAWNVVRSEFDDLLLRHAAGLGVHAYEGVRVEEIHFSPDEHTRPVSLAWSKGDGTRGDMSFNWLVDASGRNGIMSTSPLRTLRCGDIGPVPDDETGWAWFIPLHNGATSVGVVLAEDESKRKKAQHRSEFRGKSLSEVQHDCYMTDLQQAPGLIQLLGSEAKFEGKLMSAGDYSYHASEYAGSHFRIAGDAGGIHLALTGALSAASTIAASIRGNCTEEEACSFHSSKVETAYTRFLFVVLGIYKQIRAQETAVLYDAEEDNFDRAINSLRPVIQGCADADDNLTETELQNTLDFCRSVLAPNQQQNGLRTPVDTDAADVEAKHVPSDIDVPNPLQSMDDCRRNFGTEIINGFYVKMEQGTLGLVRA